MCLIFYTLKKIRKAHISMTNLCMQAIAQQENSFNILYIKKNKKSTHKHDKFMHANNSTTRKFIQ